MKKPDYKNKNISFEEKCYKVLKLVPKGKVVTYKQIAEFLGKSKAYRAVGNAMKKNKNPEVPCHRVIKSNGEIGEYNKGVNKKIKILKKEGIIIKNQKINLKKFKFSLDKIKSTNIA